MKKIEKAEMDSKFYTFFFSYRIYILFWLLVGGVLLLNLEYYGWGVLFFVGFLIVGSLYGYAYYYWELSSLGFLGEEMKKTDDFLLEDTPDKEERNSVDVQFDLLKPGGKNTFLLIKIPSSFIAEFKKYNRSLNSPSILGKKISEWGDCDNGQCVQNVLCFSKAEIKSTVEQVTNEINTAIEWLPNEHGDQSICIQKWVKFEWK